MNWQLLFFIAFCTNAVFAINFTFRFYFERKPKVNTNFYVYCVTISSAIWSIGMGMMQIQTDMQAAYWWRVFGILGTFLFMISMQKILCLISEIPEKIQNICNIVACSGILIYLAYIRPGQTIFVQSDIGMTFYFKSGIVNNIYAAYFTIVSLNIFAVTLYTLFHHNLKRVRISARRFIAIEVCVFIGAIADMFVPYLGKPAFPGSAITHFWGVFVFWFAIHNMNDSKITISNMSEYIYYSLQIPLLVFDSRKKLQIMNDASVSFFGYVNSEVQYDLLEISNLFDVDNNIFEYHGRSSSVECKCKKCHCDCQLDISKIEDDYGDIIGYILIVTDLTEHHLTLQRLEQAKMDSDAANMSKSLFLANMSHEIRTPMNAILGFAELALSESIDSHSAEYFSDIKRSGETLLSIINDILNISKIELGKQELSPISYHSASLFNDVSTIIGMQASKKNLKFEMSIDDRYPEELYGDKDKIREILINLLNNSVKYTNSGHVKFDVLVLSIDDNVANIQFKVSDSGIGIKPEDIDTIFDKFQRVDAKINSSTEGTGLGLSIVKGLVELMNGTIEVESVYGIGSVFTVVIPQTIINEAPMQVPNAAPTTKMMKQLNFNDIKVLAVDDNKVNLKVVSKILEKYGINYDLANSGSESIEKCKESLFDMVLMDQMMPVMDGIQAMKEIRKISGYEKGSNTKIIALTANVINGVKEELIECGFDGFLGKPIIFKDLETEFCRVLPPDKYFFSEIPDKRSFPVSTIKEAITNVKKKHSNNTDTTSNDSLTIDLDYGIKSCGDNENSLRQIVDFITLTCESDLGELVTSFYSKDIESFKQKITSIKSQCNCIGGKSMEELATELENAAVNDDYEYIKEHLDSFQQNYRTFCKNLKAHEFFAKK